jgi:hypothetical protein
LLSSLACACNSIPRQFLFHAGVDLGVLAAPLRIYILALRDQRRIQNETFQCNSYQRLAKPTHVNVGLGVSLTRSSAVPPPLPESYQVGMEQWVFIKDVKFRCSLKKYDRSKMMLTKMFPGSILLLIFASCFATAVSIPNSGLTAASTKFNLLKAARHPRHKVRRLEHEWLTHSASFSYVDGMLLSVREKLLTYL